MRHTIKLNGIETQVINGIVEMKANPPMPKHEPPPAELRGTRKKTKKFRDAFKKWAEAGQSRHEVALAGWRKNRDDIVYMTINFPDAVFKWMRPRSKIPGRKKDFTIRDIIEIDSKLCVHLKDNRNLGAGSIEDQVNGVMLANELMLARESKKSDEPESFTTFKDAAAWCGRTEKTLRNWRDSDFLKVEKCGARKIRILRRDLEECLRHK